MIEVAWIIKEYKRGSMTKIGVHIGLTVACTLLFHFGLKLRANVGRLPPEDLEPFLVDTLFKGGLRTLLTLLFLFFRTTKCWFEEGGLATCANVSWCSSMLSTFAILWWFVGSVQGSVKREWRHDLNLSIDKIARMNDISLRRGVGGFLTTVTGLCGIFLFSMISADEMDDTTITVVGFLGGAAILGVVISEIYSSLLRQKRMHTLSQSQSKLGIKKAAGDAEDEGLVEECSWMFVGVSFLLTSMWTVAMVLHGITLEMRYWLIGSIVLPISFVSFVIALMAKPKREDVGYTLFLIFHFILFAVVSEAALAYANFQLGLLFSGLFAVTRIVIWVCLFWLGLKLRKTAATLLSKQELSEFLCQTLLTKGSAAIGTMLFLSFESVSCFISQGRNARDGQCTNTTMVSLIYHYI